MSRNLSIYTLLTLLLSGGLASAHAFAPAAALIEETTAQRYQVTFRRSTPFAAALSLELPASCQQGARRTTIEGDQTIDRFTLQCPAPLQGQTVRVLGLAELSIGAVLHAQFLDGRSVRELLSAQRMSVVIPDTSWLAEVFFGYLRLGVEHLLTGLDHVLFVIGLLCLVAGFRHILWTLTAFTLGHSVTLCLSALSIIALPQAPVEVGIALSLLVIALEIAHTAAPVAGNTAPSTGAAVGMRSMQAIKAGRSWRIPTIPRSAIIASVFGLLHGLGFAGALAETGLPEDDIPLSLFAFNLGVEFGQVLIVLATLPFLWVLSRRVVLRKRTWRLSAAYLIGSLAGMWFIERVAALLA